MEERKYDACRILATCYKEIGQYDLIKPTLELIPEIYFSKLELMASLLDGDDSYEAAQKQKNISAEDLIDMLIVTVMDAFSEDFLETQWFMSTIYEYTSKQRKEIEKLLIE